MLHRVVVVGVALTGLMVTANGAWAMGPYLGAQVGMGRHDVSVSGSTTTGLTNQPSSKLTLRGYLGVRILPGDLLSLEGGAGFGDQSYTSSQSGASQKVTYPVFFMDAAARLNPIPYISIGAGGYMSVITGMVKAEANGSTLNISAGTAGFEYLDKGLLGSLRIYIPVLPAFKITAEARYLLGMVDTSKSTTVVAKTRELQYLAGAEFGF